MTMTFTLTANQVRQIYEAGIQRGNDESYRYVSLTKYWELYDEIHDIVNEGKEFGADDRIDYATVKSWFGESK